MSPILVRPVREQLEHDRVIRLLQVKYKRKFEVAVNPGLAQVAPVGSGPDTWYPDLVLQANEKSRKLQGVVEVETAESVNHLEAMSQWARFAKLRVPFHLYVPASAVDSARRLCTDLQIPADELWAYQTIGDQLRFALIQRSAAAEAAARAAAARAAAQAPASASSAKATGRTAVAKTTAPAKNGKNGTPAATRPGAKSTPPARVASRVATKVVSAKAAPSKVAAKPAKAGSAKVSTPESKTKPTAKAVASQRSVAARPGAKTERRQASRTASKPSAAAKRK